MTQKLKDSLARMCDTVLAGKEPEVALHSRRVWLQNFAAVTATSAVVWSCGKSDDDKATAGTGDYSAADKKSDATTMNVALGLEHEAIALYTAAAGLPVWGTDVNALAPTFLDVAKEFLKHHTAHREALIAQINLIKADSGVDPVAAKDATEYLKPYPTIASQTGLEGLITVLQVAAEREMYAANAYYSVIATFKNMKLMQTLGGLSSDESGHFGVLNAAAFAVAALTGKTALVKYDATNLVPGALPPYKFANPDIRAST
jgi:rubrerythrin